MKNLQLKACIFCAETVEKLLLLKENAQLIFFYVEDCMPASENISLIFKERATASEKILRKNVRLILKENLELLLLKNDVHLKNI